MTVIINSEPFQDVETKGDPMVKTKKLGLKRILTLFKSIQLWFSVFEIYKRCFSKKKFRIATPKPA